MHINNYKKIMTRFIFSEMANADDDEVFVIDMIDYPGYAIHSNGSVENTKTGRTLKPRIINGGYYHVDLKNRDGNYKNVYVHKLVARYFIKNPDKKRCIDHIDRDRLNNDYRNLRWATYLENSRNHSKRSDNTSGYIGVCWNKKANKWKVQIKVNGKNIYIGVYDDIEDAKRARAEKVELYFGEYGNE